MLNLLPMPLIIIALISLIAFLKRHRRRDLGIFAISAALILLLLLDSSTPLLPSATYDTPEEVCYQAYSLQKNEQLLVLEGKNSAWVVGQNPEGKTQYGIVQKVDTQWTKSSSKDNVLVKMLPCSAAGIFIYRFADTNDYYIMLLGNGTGIDTISDSLDSVFYPDAVGENYYAYIPDFSADYWIEINGERPPLLK